MNRAKVWVVSPFSTDVSSDRYSYICRQLIDEGADVCQFVSRFDHASKQARVQADIPWRRVRVWEPGYRRNVSFRRVLSHVVFDLLVVFYFVRQVLTGGVPGAILCALPHNGAATVAAVFSRLIGARFIVDVHDTWPESILSVTRLNAVTRVAFRVWKWLADFALARADVAFAESVAYARRGDDARLPRGRSSTVPIYIGGDLSYYRRIESVRELPAPVCGARFVLAYAGTLGDNYDLDCLLDAFAEFARECPDAGLLLLGAGEREAALRARITAERLPVWISGRVPHAELIARLKGAHVAFNCFKEGGNVAYSYKINDYLLAGVPVVNSLPGEAAEMISSYGLGENYRAGDAGALLQAIRRCRALWLDDPTWSERIRSFASRLLDRRTTYAPLIDACLGAPGAAAGGAAASARDRTAV